MHKLEFYNILHTYDIVYVGPFFRCFLLSAAVRFNKHGLVSLGIWWYPRLHVVHRWPVHLKLYCAI